MAKQKRITDFSMLKDANIVFSDEKKTTKVKANVEIVNPNPNIGWLFYRTYYDGIKELKNDAGIALITKNKKLLDIKEKEKIVAFFSEKHAVIKDAGFLLPEIELDASFVSFCLKTTYPGLVTGIGLVHETGLIGEAKLGFQFDYTTGLPYLPGSSIKGLLRSAFPFSLNVKKTDENNPEVINYRNNRFSYLKEVFGNLTVELSEEEIVALEFAIFAGTDKNGKALQEPSRDIFADAIISNYNENIVATDFITPHKDPLKDPNPVQFIKILPEVAFQFSFKLSDTVLLNGKAFTLKGFEKRASENEDTKTITAEQKLSLFRQILLDFGIGAKTNVGYGQLVE